MTAAIGIPKLDIGPQKSVDSNTNKPGIPLSFSEARKDSPLSRNKYGGLTTSWVENVLGLDCDAGSKRLTCRAEVIQHLVRSYFRVDGFYCGCHLRGDLEGPSE
jgi:hypothetical protein